MRLLPACLLALLSGATQAQQLSEIPQGLRDATPRWHALTGARLVLAPGQVVENGTLVMKDGVIVAAGADVKPPAGAKVWALPGRTVYAGFIDAASGLGQGRIETSKAKGLTPGQRWVRSEFHQAAALEIKPEEVRAAREQGFTMALSLPPSGAVFRGQSALISLREGSDARGLVLAADVAQHLAHEYTTFDFESGGRAGNLSYPTSLMGSIALQRQTLLNARWAAGPQPKGERREFNAGLIALAPALAGKQPVVHEALDEEDLLRIAKLRDEFGLKLIAQGTGHEYRKAAQLKTLGLSVILPLAYPAAPEVEQPESALDVPLHQLQHWERAPGNAAALQAAGVEFAISSQGIKDLKKDFWPRLRQAVQRGLKPEAALAALTTTPARLFNQPRLGRLAPGHLAHVIVASGDLFTSEQAEVEIAFVDGQPLTTEAWERFDARGRWSIKAAGGAEQTWQIAGTRARPTLLVDGKACELQQRGRELLLRWPCDGGTRESLRLEGRGATLVGALALADGRTQAWTATRVAPFEPPAPKPPVLASPSPATYPAGVFGRAAPPERPVAVLVRNATVWTSAAAGILEATDLLVRDGRIAAIGKGLAAPAGAHVIDAQGRHLTPGLIDAHSHTAVNRGINEFAHSVTAEVRVGDVVDATDISLYRQLAGGVTSSHLLHGSANAIGGQDQVIKLRWGLDAESLKFEGAQPGIKFALGENVKRANFPAAADSDPRYPTTRMGVEQLMRDAFLAAQVYRERRKADPTTRRDLQMDTLVELLEKKRVIHIHSYRADEILMFVALAKEFGLDVATFQHVLEAYKVAPEIASLGAGASGFSDWWGYKVEVQDAIPYSGAMTRKAGVLTSFNSDSDELARRLNTEAAKALRYGGKDWGMDEAEALKFVTVNPARQLRIDGRVGSLEVGKDADFVLWSANPLSSAARAEQTWIDGRRYFDRGEDAQLRERDRAERARLVALALPERAKAAAPPEGRPATPVTAALDQLELQRWLHEANRDRHSYFGGDAWHECTLDAY